MLAAGLLGFAACTGDLEDRVTSLENRLDKLEAMVNDNVTSIKNSHFPGQNGDACDSVRPTTSPAVSGRCGAWL